MTTPAGTGPEGCADELRLQDTPVETRLRLARAADGVRRHLYLVPAVYFCLATAWILFSDHAVSLLGDHALEERLQSVKGIFYVLVTTALLALLVRGQFRRLVALAEGLGRVSAEREELLREVHHRVKNNLQVMESLLGLQAGALDDPACAEVLGRAAMRFKSMALVHESLYQSTDMTAVDFAAYLNRLAEVVRGRCRAAGSVELTVRAGEVRLPITRAVPCGMIAGELIDNALRHAFAPGGGGRVEVDLSRDDGHLVLSVADDGRGISTRDKAGGFGLSLVDLLARQIGGSVTHVSDNTGTKVRVRFPE
jgi:two-component sensor histidine kinase